MTKEELRQLPKVELHCHLDGSLTERSYREKAWKTSQSGRTHGF